MLWLIALQLVIEPMPLPENKVWVWPLEVEAMVEVEVASKTELKFSKFFRSGPVACGYVSSEAKGVMPKGTHRFAVLPREDSYRGGLVLLSYRKADVAEINRICGDSW